jgi:glycogen operon protein
LLDDLVSYNGKHNEANGEDNRDGSNDNHSWNCGAEGPTDDAAVRALRTRQKRNLIATLLLSEGVPMICGGDEVGHTQRGNNNAYCQDNHLTWINWSLDDEKKDFLEFVRLVTRIRRDQPVFQRRKFFLGRKIRGSDMKDISWFGPDGKEMSDEAWNAGFVRCLGMRLAGDVIDELDERGERLFGETLLMLISAHHEPLKFVLPATRAEHHWETVLDTSVGATTPTVYQGGQEYLLQGRSLALLRTRLAEETGQPVTPAQVEKLRQESRRPGPPREAPAVPGSV